MLKLNNLMTTEQKDMKMSILAQQKRNLAKKVTYWRTKFENECFIVDDDDDADLQKMIENVDESRIPENFQLLLQQQRMALKCKRKTSHRWHPK